MFSGIRCSCLRKAVLGDMLACGARGWAGRAQVREHHRKFLRDDAVCIALQQDDTNSRLLVRFSCADSNMRCLSGTLGIVLSDP